MNGLDEQLNFGGFLYIGSNDIVVVVIIIFINGVFVCLFVCLFCGGGGGGGGTRITFFFFGHLDIFLLPGNKYNKDFSI